jgi:DNA repair ATPase RecN
MTVTDEGVDVSVEPDEDQTEAQSEEGKKRDRDFTKFREAHQELADYVNANSGLDPVTPNQVKAIQTLKSDFNATPEQVAKREQRKAEREAEKRKYEGMSDEQIKAAKAADRVDKQASKLEERLREAREKAQRIREGKEASGEDLAAAVESAQNGVEPEATEEDKPRRRLGRNR